MEEIWREGASPFLEEVIAWPNRLSQRKHAGLLRQPVALPKVTRGTGGDDVFPGGTPTPGPRNDMIKGQIFSTKAIATVLTREAVTKEYVEARERWLSLQGYVFPERDNTRKLHREAWRVHLVFVFRDHIDPVHKHSLHRVLPRPDRERKIAQRPKIRVEDQSWIDTFSGRQHNPPSFWFEGYYTL